MPCMFADKMPHRGMDGRDVKRFCFKPWSRYTSSYIRCPILSQFGTKISYNSKTKKYIIHPAWEDDVRVRPCPVGCGLGDYWLLTDETELTSIVRYVLPHSFSPSICYERETRHVYVQALVNDQGIH